MKKTLLLAIATLFATVSFAQQQLATLNHNDSITVYYGTTALQQAHAAAVNGDIITLSPGTFSSVNITKAVSIKGAGMGGDTTNQTSVTYLSGNFFLNIPNDTNNALSISYVCIRGQMKYHIAYRPTFLACRFVNDIDAYGCSCVSNDDFFVNPTFIGCILNGIYSVYYSRSGAYFYNCYINGGHNSIPSTYSMSHDMIIIDHCLVNNIYSSIYEDCTISNSILIKTDNTYSYSYGNVFNCIGIGNAEHPFFVNNDINNNINYPTCSQVFKTFNGTYANMQFDLLDSVAAITGSDNTQIGLYGGGYPLNMLIRLPSIIRCNVANRSTADGKLAVDIEVVSE